MIALLNLCGVSSLRFFVRNSHARFAPSHIAVFVSGVLVKLDNQLGLLALRALFEKWDLHSIT